MEHVFTQTNGGRGTDPFTRRKIYLCRRGGLSRSLLRGQVSLKSFPQARDVLPKGTDFLVTSLGAGLQLHLLLDQRFPLRLHHRNFVPQVVVDFHQARLLLLELHGDTHVL